MNRTATVVPLLFLLLVIRHLEAEEVPAAQQTISRHAVDSVLLSTTIEQGLNEVRNSEHRASLCDDGRARNAAELQAAIMAASGVLTHENEGTPELRTPLDRAKQAGLTPRVILENVAFLSLLDAPPDTPLFIRKEDNDTVASTTPDGPRLKSHTYLSFARQLVREWMESRGHRDNILSPETACLGASCKESTKDWPVYLYCAAVFYR